MRASSSSPRAPSPTRTTATSPSLTTRLKVAFSSGRFFEEGDLPSDATVVERMWRFSRPDGSPDPRYKNDNVEIPVVLYRLLEIAPLRTEVRLRSRTGWPRPASPGRSAPRSQGGAEGEEGRPRRRTRRADKDSGRSSSKEGERSAVPRRHWRGRPGSPRREGLSGCRRGRGRGDQRRIQEACADPSP